MLQIPSLFVSLYARETILHSVCQYVTANTHQDTHSCNTRNASNFTLATNHLSLFEKKPSHNEAPYYNRLPDHIKREIPQELKKN